MDMIARRADGTALLGRITREQIETIAAVSLDPLALFTYEGPDRLRHEWIDARCLEGTGLTVEAVTGRLLHDCFPKIAPRFHRHAEDAIATRTSVRYEGTSRVADGSVRSLELTVRPIFDGDRCVQVLAALRDISDRLALERERAATERRLRKLMEHAPDIVWLIGPEGQVLYATAALGRILGYDLRDLIGHSSFELVPEEDLPALQAFFGGVLSTDEPIAHSTELRTRCADGSIRWVECVVSNLLGDPDIGAIVVNAHDITARKLVEEQLAHDALHDSLTGLPNRMLVPEQIGAGLRAATDDDHLSAVLFIDFDNFKLVNDTLGHETGDLVIREAAQRLRATIGDRGWVARFGGDEFIIIPAQVATLEQHTALAENLGAALAEPFTLGGSPVYLTASVGVATGTSTTSDPQTMLRNADMAMYEAKRLRRGSVQPFDDSLRRLAEHRLDTMNSLRSAIEDEQLVLHYQPIYSNATRTVWGVEALMRWNHPTRGLVMPGEFIAIAEDTGLILPMGRWALEQSCQQLADWARRGFARLKASVNVSPKQLLDPDFVDTVRAAIARAGIDPASLIIEITENVIMEDPPAARAVLQTLSSLGVGCAIDDFGMGYSSLAYLTQFPATSLKIDRTFVTALDGQLTHTPTECAHGTALVGAIIGMAHALGLGVVAEGVETEAQLVELRRLGCEYTQGFHLARPAPADLIEHLLRRRFTTALAG